VIVGGDDATSAAHAIQAVAPGARDLTGRTTLAELAAVVHGAEAVVGGDSFIGHLAAALDRPLVAIFGPSNDGAWKPYGATRDAEGILGRRLVVRQDLPCAPCLYTGFALGRPAGCPTRTCLTTLPVERVAAAVRLVCQEA
jgi:ADP-heptose:LPS heptosyltransferase